MKIKHFAGYGTVNAKKIGAKNEGTNIYGEPMKVVVIEVSGNHEWGLERDDTYDIYNWLVKRFAKDCKSYTDIESMQVNDRYETDDKGFDVEHCTYTIKYKVAA